MTRDVDERARARCAYELSIARDPVGPFEPLPLDEQARLERAVMALPRATRAIFLAHRLDGQSYGDIAPASGLSERQVERRMASAIRHLRRCLHHQQPTQLQRWWRTLLLRWRR